MLQRLYIKNIALISEADIEFDGGLNVLSGETGSGKSVILDSINFVLGSKADKTMIRYGEQEAFVRAEFCVAEGSAAAARLAELDIETDGNVIISRKLSLDGKNSVKINGSGVTAAMLKSVTQHLVDVHGQSEHFFLLSEENQLSVIDGISGEKVISVKEKLRNLLSQKRAIKENIKKLGGNAEERERKADLLRYEIDEIERADVKENEFEELKSRQNIILNTEKILSSINAVRAIISDDGGCADGISSAQHIFNGISSYGENYEKISERLEGLSAEATDIAETLSDLADELIFDEREAQEIDDRLTLLKALRKKYGADEKQILEFLNSARQEYDLLADSANAAQKFNEELLLCNKNIFAECKKLTALRKAAAKGFCESVTGELKTLNIPNASFSVNFAEYDEDGAEFTANGADKLCFMFSANKGEPEKPLSKVISGGEMSRFMLAVKTVLKDVNGISTYIFDEIDAGISGFTAKTVAEKFITISKCTQILAVSHLPQVCAASDAQYLIYKIDEGGKTVTKVKRLDGESKIEEIVRLTGSVYSAAARQHAIELIAQFK